MSYDTGPGRLEHAAVAEAEVEPQALGRQPRS